MSAPNSIRIVGDPVLRRRAEEVVDIDGPMVRLVEDMFETMYAAPGLGLAAPQVGVGKRFFVYDLGDDTGRHVIVNPEVTGSEGEWEFAEGCLSVPGLHFDIVRPKLVNVRGLDLDGNPVEFEADELLGRLIQHELDHLDGILLIDLLDDAQRREAKKTIREMKMGLAEPAEEPERRSFFRFR
jgi:peptide deformylase